MDELTTYELNDKKEIVINVNGDGQLTCIEFAAYYDGRPLLWTLAQFAGKEVRWERIKENGKNGIKIWLKE